MAIENTEPSLTTINLSKITKNDIDQVIKKYSTLFKPSQLVEKDLKKTNKRKFEEEADKLKEKQSVKPANAFAYKSKNLEMKPLPTFKRMKHWDEAEQSSFVEPSAYERILPAPYQQIFPREALLTYGLPHDEITAIQNSIDLDPNILRRAHEMYDLILEHRRNFAHELADKLTVVYDKIFTFKYKFMVSPTMTEHHNEEERMLIDEAENVIRRVDLHRDQLDPNEDYADHFDHIHTANATINQRLYTAIDMLRNITAHTARLQNFVHEDIRRQDSDYEEEMREEPERRHRRRRRRAAYQEDNRQFYRLMGDYTSDESETEIKSEIKSEPQERFPEIKREKEEVLEGLKDIVRTLMNLTGDQTRVLRRLDERLDNAEGLNRSIDATLRQLAARTTDERLLVAIDNLSRHVEILGTRLPANLPAAQVSQIISSDLQLIRDNVLDERSRLDFNLLLAELKKFTHQPDFSPITNALEELKNQVGDQRILQSLEGIKAAITAGDPKLAIEDMKRSFLAIEDAKLNELKAITAAQPLAIQGMKNEMLAIEYNRNENQLALEDTRRKNLLAIEDKRRENQLAIEAAKNENRITLADLRGELGVLKDAYENMMQRQQVGQLSNHPALSIEELSSETLNTRIMDELGNKIRVFNSQLSSFNTEFGRLDIFQFNALIVSLTRFRQELQQQMDKCKQIADSFGPPPPPPSAGAQPLPAGLAVTPSETLSLISSQKSNYNDYAPIGPPVVTQSDLKNSRVLDVSVVPTTKEGPGYVPVILSDPNNNNDVQMEEQVNITSTQHTNDNHQFIENYLVNTNETLGQLAVHSMQQTARILDWANSSPKGEVLTANTETIDKIEKLVATTQQNTETINKLEKLVAENNTIKKKEKKVPQKISGNFNAHHVATRLPSSHTIGTNTTTSVVPYDQELAQTHEKYQKLIANSVGTNTTIGKAFELKKLEEDNQSLYAPSSIQPKPPRSNKKYHENYNVAKFQPLANSTELPDVPEFDDDPFETTISNSIDDVNVSTKQVNLKQVTRDFAEVMEALMVNLFTSDDFKPTKFLDTWADYIYKAKNNNGSPDEEDMDDFISNLRSGKPKLLSPATIRVRIAQLLTTIDSQSKKLGYNQHQHIDVSAKTISDLKEAVFLNESKGSSLVYTMGNFLCNSSNILKNLYLAAPSHDNNIDFSRSQILAEIHRIVNNCGDTIIKIQTPLKESQRKTLDPKTQAVPLAISSDGNYVNAISSQINSERAEVLVDTGEKRTDLEAPAPVTSEKFYQEAEAEDERLRTPVTDVPLYNQELISTPPVVTAKEPTNYREPTKRRLDKTVDEEEKNKLKKPGELDLSNRIANIRKNLLAYGKKKPTDKGFAVIAPTQKPGLNRSSSLSDLNKKIGAETVDLLTEVVRPEAREDLTNDQFNRSDLERIIDSIAPNSATPAGPPKQARFETGGAPSGEVIDDDLRVGHGRRLGRGVKAYAKNLVRHMKKRFKRPVEKTDYSNNLLNAIKFIKRGKGTDVPIKCARCGFHKNLKYSKKANESQCDKCIKGYGVTYKDRYPEEEADYVDINESPVADSYKKQEFMEYISSLPRNESLSIFIESCRPLVPQIEGLCEQLNSIIYFDMNSLSEFEERALVVSCGLLTHSEYHSPILRANFSIGSIMYARARGIKDFDVDYVDYSINDFKTFNLLKQKIDSKPEILLTFISSDNESNS